MGNTDILIYPFFLLAIGYGLVTLMNDYPIPYPLLERYMGYLPIVDPIIPRNMGNPLPFYRYWVIIGLPIHTH